MLAWELFVCHEAVVPDLLTEVGTDSIKAN